MTKNILIYGEKQLNKMKLNELNKFFKAWTDKAKEEMRRHLH